MPIAFDAASNGQATATSVTVAHTTSGQNRVLAVCVSTETNDTCTGVTYNAVAMTKVGSSVQNSGNSAWVSLWLLVAPTTGANNIVASNSASSVIAVAAASYTGAAQSQPNANSSATTQAVSVTSTVDNCWAVMGSQTNTSPTTAGANTSLRAEGGTWGNSLFDSNAAFSVGARTLNQGNGSAWASVIVALAPVRGSMLAVF